MKETYPTPELFAADVVKAARGAWVNGTYTVASRPVGIKAYGKWVQRIQCNGMIDSGQFRTQRDMAAFIVSHIGH